MSMMYLCAQAHICIYVIAQDNFRITTVGAGTPVETHRDVDGETHLYKGKISRIDDEGVHISFENGAQEVWGGANEHDYAKLFVCVESVKMKLPYNSVRELYGIEKEREREKERETTLDFGDVKARSSVLTFGM